MCPSSCVPLAAKDEYWTNEAIFMSSELVGKTVENKTGWSHVTETRGSPGRVLENSSERDCILTGDFFELNDLIDPGSCSSTSSDSSCLTMTSEEYFDSIALLQELQDDIIDQEMKDSSVKYNPSAPVKSKEVELHTATSVLSPRNNKECKPSAEETSKAEKRPASTSNGANITSSSSNSINTSKEGNNEHVRRTKRRKIMKYLCFLGF